MLFQLTELEYDIIDLLADGPASLAMLLRAGEKAQHPWELGLVVTALLGMLERQLLRCSRVPGSVAFQIPAREALVIHATRGHDAVEGDYWFELSERGQAVWEMWLQARQVS
ncbi:MAG: hypothetical protein BWY76_03245 [bacterium ADurb.Bin429]|nr:MAG: hypothetical protein BWY76_03245 [bacterium ADurb.Bin429]